MRWSAAYRASVYGDTADTADTKVIGDGGMPSPDATDAAFKAAERAAIIAEGTGDPQGKVPHTMPCSWADPAIVPTPGACCRNCGGCRWWCEAEGAKGWRCVACHPPVHLLPGLVRVIRTHK